MPKITYIDDCQSGVTIPTESTETILEAALHSDIEHYHVCGGHARCTTCRVYILEGQEHLCPRTEAEMKIAQNKNWPDKIRLACQTKVQDDVTLKRLVIDHVDAELAYSENQTGRFAEEYVLAVMFCDLEQFTSFAAEHLHNPYDVIHLLNRFYQEIGGPIVTNHGVIDNYMGDGFLAFFGLNDNNTTPTETCLNMIRASLRMLARVKELNRYISRQFSHRFKIRIGLHYGPVIMGEVGYHANKKPTLIGNTVNVASRIENANKEFGTQILASQDLIETVQDKIEIGQTFRTQLRGQNRIHQLHEIVGFKTPDTIFLVQSTLEKILPSIDECTHQFYQQLFELAPNIEPMFNGIDLKARRNMLTSMIKLVAQGINDFDDFKPSPQQIHDKHDHLSLKKTDYLMTVKAFIMMLEKCLDKENFTPAVKQAWTDFYETLIKNHF
jgi:adenylate cyclase